MRFIMLLLLVLFFWLQYRLWFGNGGLLRLWSIQEQIALQQADNETLYERNQALQAEVIDLKTGMDAIEERARTEMGMIRKDEQFIYIIEPPPRKK